MTSALGASTVPSVFSCKEGGLYCVKGGKPYPHKAVFPFVLLGKTVILTG